MQIINKDFEHDSDVTSTLNSLISLEFFPPPRFFNYTNEKKNPNSMFFSPTYLNGNNVPTPHLFQLHSY